LILLANSGIPFYEPSTDKLFSPWYDNGVEQKYPTPAYGIANLPMARSAIEKFFDDNFAGYIEAHMVNATEITRVAFKAAQDHKVRPNYLEGFKRQCLSSNPSQKHLPLVERALKLWVGCRFIEKPWSIVGLEALGMNPDVNVNSPFHDSIPVPPM
jgi:hypothetical protein